MLRFLNRGVEVRLPIVNEHDLAHIPSPGACRCVGQQELHELQRRCRRAQPSTSSYPRLRPKVLRHQSAPVDSEALVHVHPPYADGSLMHTRRSNSFNSSSLNARTLTGSSGFPIRSSLNSSSSVSSAHQTLSSTSFDSCPLSAVSSRYSPRFRRRLDIPSRRTALEDAFSGTSSCLTRFVARSSWMSLLWTSILSFASWTLRLPSSVAYTSFCIRAHDTSHQRHRASSRDSPYTQQFSRTPGPLATTHLYRLFFHVMFGWTDHGESQLQAAPTPRRCDGSKDQKNKAARRPAKKKSQNSKRKKHFIMVAQLSGL